MGKKYLLFTLAFMSMPAATATAAVKAGALAIGLPTTWARLQELRGSAPSEPATCAETVLADLISRFASVPEATSVGRFDCGALNIDWERGTGRREVFCLFQTNGHVTVETFKTLVQDTGPLSDEVECCFPAQAAELIAFALGIGLHLRQP